MDKKSQSDNQYKLNHAIRITFIFVGVALLAGHVSINTQLAMGIFMSYQLWGWFWIKIVLQSPNIYSIKVPTTVIDDWVQVSLPSTDAIKIRKDRTVTSISELSGVRGALMNIGLRVMTATINMLILVAIQADLHARDAVFGVVRSQEDMVPIGLLIISIGFFLTGHFELNMVDAFHTKGHFLGVFLLFWGTLGHGFCFKWSAPSIFLIVLQFAVSVFWVNFTKNCVKKSVNIHVVTWNSKLCIGIELFMFYVTNIILVSTVYACGANEGNLFASPWK